MEEVDDLSGVCPPARLSLPSLVVKVGCLLDLQLDLEEGNMEQAQARVKAMLDSCPEQESGPCKKQK